MRFMATITKDELADKNGRRFGSQVYQEPGRMKKTARRIFVNVNPKSECLCYTEGTVRDWSDSIMRDLRIWVKKPFLGLFGGTKEISLVGPGEPLLQVELVLRLIRTLRQEGFRGSINLITSGEANRYNHRWINGSACHSIDELGREIVEVTHPAHEAGIAAYLKSAGLDSITIVPALERYADVEPDAYHRTYLSEASREFIEECRKTGLNTHLRLVVDPSELGRWQYGAYQKEWIGFIGGDNYRMKVLLGLKLSNISVWPGQVQKGSEFDMTCQETTD